MDCYGYMRAQRIQISLRVTVMHCLANQSRDTYRGVLLGPTHVAKGSKHTEQREGWGPYTATAKTSANLRCNSRPRMAFQNCPKLGQGDLYRLLYWPVVECNLCRKEQWLGAETYFGHQQCPGRGPWLYTLLVSNPASGRRASVLTRGNGLAHQSLPW